MLSTHFVQDSSHLRCCSPQVRHRIIVRGCCCFKRADAAAVESVDPKAAKFAELASLTDGILPNARLRMEIGDERIRRSLGVDFGLQRTGVAVSLCGYSPSPLVVLKMKGERLVEELIRIAKLERADEFIVGLPKSVNLEETDQCKKVRDFAFQLAKYSAPNGTRVFLQDEYGTTEEALEFMIEKGKSKKSRRLDIDAYAAMIILQTYFNSDGRSAYLVVPKRWKLQKKLCAEYYKWLNHSEKDDQDDDDFDFVIG